MKRCKDCKNKPIPPKGCQKGHTINICTEPRGELRPMKNPCPDFSPTLRIRIWHWLKK